MTPVWRRSEALPDETEQEVEKVRRNSSDCQSDLGTRAMRP